jgi:peptidoglycan/LPS O-acetylase OafA/YrhL
MDNRSNNFDCVRLLAALAVIYGHAFPLALMPSPSLFGNSIQALAVKIFFTISGFLICKSWTNSSNFGSYLAKRVLRIFPALIVLTLFTTLLIGPLLTNLSLSDYFSNSTTLNYLQNIRLYPVYNLVDLFNDNAYKGAVNGSLWSLPVEFFMYLFIALIAIKKDNGGSPSLLWILTAITCAVSLRFVHYSQPTSHPVFYGTDLISALDVIPYFMIGALYSYYSLERFLNSQFALFAIGFSALFQPSSTILQETLLYIVVPYSILSFAVARTAVLHRAGRFGDLSYGIYLYGFLLQQIVNSITKNNLTAFQNAIVSMPLAVLCAYISWHVIERPALKYKTGLNLVFSRGK